jgi:predicted nucleic acid-binding protein
VEPPFLGTNVVLRHFLGDHHDQSPRATTYIAQVERGERRVRTADTVVFETVFVLERTFHHPKALIRDGVLGVLNLPGLLLPGKRRLRRAFALYVDLNLPFADAYHAVLAMELGAGQIVSFDRDCDRVTDVCRSEP